MHTSELGECAACADCGAEIWPARDRSYPISDDDAICYECARRRGGEYDELMDTWTAAPDVSGLALSPPL